MGGGQFPGGFGHLREIADGAGWFHFILSISIVRWLAVIICKGLVESCGHPILP